MKAGRTREQALAFHGDHGPRCLAELLDTDGTGRVGDLGPLLCPAVLVADFVAAIWPSSRSSRAPLGKRPALLKSPLRSPPENCGNRIGAVVAFRKVAVLLLPSHPLRMRTRPEKGA
jgi:hypothetical protein